MKVVSSGLRLPIRRGPVEFSLGSEADHEAVYQTLLHVFHGPDRDAFLGALSDPSYHPDQRLVARIDNRIASHLHLTERPMRYGSVILPLNGVVWVATLPEYRGLGLAHSLLRLAALRSAETGAVLQTLTNSMPAFYRALGWCICGRQTFGVVPSRSLPASGDGLMESKGGLWHVRPWRQVELNDLMDLYDAQYGNTVGSVARSEDYWRWMIGRRYAHVIWVACQSERVRGYAFVKDHKVLEIATDPACPQALQALLGRVRAEALERAYPEVIIHAPADHPALDAVREGGGRVVDQEIWEGSCSMYHVPDPDRLLEAILPELARRARKASPAPSWPLELGLAIGEQHWLVHIDPKSAHIERDKLSRRYLALTPSAFTRLVLGHTSVDQAVSEEGVEASTATSLGPARILFPPGPIWRSPLDGATG